MAHRLVQAPVTGGTLEWAHMQTIKKREEMLITSFFLQKLNETHGTHYVAELVDSEQTRVDTRGRSAVSGEHSIAFQVTYADNGLPHEGGAVLGRNFRTHAGNVVDLTTPYDVAAAIERKQDRYGMETASRLVLLIWKTKSCIIDPKGLGWEHENIWFRGCYYVCLPGGGTPGQVTTLKPMVAADGSVYDLEHGTMDA
jgi:hypothetical protein